MLQQISGVLCTQRSGVGLRAAVLLQAGAHLAEASARCLSSRDDLSRPARPACWYIWDASIGGCTPQRGGSAKFDRCKAGISAPVPFSEPPDAQHRPSAAVRRCTGSPSRPSPNSCLLGCRARGAVPGCCCEAASGQQRAQQVTGAALSGLPLGQGTVWRHTCCPGLAAAQVHASGAERQWMARPSVCKRGRGVQPQELHVLRMLLCG